MFQREAKSSLVCLGRVQMSVIPETTQVTLALTIIDIIDNKEIQ
jgi:hypothetical protein